MVKCPDLGTQGPHVEPLEDSLKHWVAGLVTMQVVTEKAAGIIVS